MHIEKNRWCYICGTDLTHHVAPIKTEHDHIQLCGFECALHYTQKGLNKEKQEIERQDHEQNDTVQDEHLSEESTRTPTGEQLFLFGEV